MKILFMGTPDFAAGSLKSLIEAGYEISAVITQPDRPKGRSGAPVFSPVKEVAVAAGIPVLQPERIKRPEETAKLLEYPADIYVVAAFGQILSKEILEQPKYGCINVHASLLPKYRGASPIQRVILDGEKETGITIMQMNEGLDTGDILYQKKYELAPDETFETLHDRLMDLGGQALLEALPLIEEGKITPVTQDDSLSCYAPLIKKEDGLIDFKKTAVQIDAQIRAFNPWPGAFTRLEGKTLKIWEASLCEKSGKPGEIIDVDKNSFTVACSEGSIRVMSLQAEGKKRMDTSAFLLGKKLSCGTVLG
ncbi:MAG: methionyl-tRNA formyltransferase [Lachnospiraceae bacterium]|nr:methionyl-tRNA formyltransferase [Lachnospiraceae bacterium]